jgi:hypothetical protein
MVDSIVVRLAVAIKRGMQTHKDFPFDVTTPQAKRSKPHMLETALTDNVIIHVSPEISYFHIGNPNAESKTPHYHILEDAQTIRMPGRGTKKTLGSQASKPKEKRDYSVYLPPQQKTNRLTQEYRTSYTSGRRSYVPTTKMLRNLRDKTLKEKKKLPYRYNKHFAYIERILEDILPGIAENLDLTLSTPKGNVQQLYQGENGEITSTPPFNPSTGEILGG